MWKIGNKGSSAVLTVSLKNDLLKKRVSIKELVSTPAHTATGQVGWATRSPIHKAASLGSVQSKNKITLLFHSHPLRKGSSVTTPTCRHSPIPSLPLSLSLSLFLSLSLSHAHTHTHTHTHTLANACSAPTFYVLSSSSASHAWKCLDLLLARYCDLGIFFKRFFYYKPNGSCIQAPDEEELTG